MIHIPIIAAVGGAIAVVGGIHGALTAPDGEAGKGFLKGVGSVAKVAMPLITCGLHDGGSTSDSGTDSSHHHNSSDYYSS